MGSLFVCWFVCLLVYLLFVSFHHFHEFWPVGQKKSCVLRTTRFIAKDDSVYDTPGWVDALARVKRA